MDSPRFRALGDRLRRWREASSRYPPNRWSIEDAERQLAGRPVEWAVVFDEHGRQLFRRRGTRQFVRFPGDDVALLAGATVVHNHPADVGETDEALTVSLTDLVFAVRYDVRQVRAVTPGWRFVVTRPDTGWPADETIVAEVYSETRAEVEAEFRLAVTLGTMTDEDAARLLYHEVMRRVASWGGFVYVKERT
jgi:hypothetical protein